ncbi:MAG: M56 family metallopeptidase, partial [Bacteroidota bacterium]
MANILTYSTGMTLLHSLWQIVLVYLAMRVLLTLLKNSSSFLRYGISIAALFSVFIISLSTFYIYYQKEKEGALYVSELITQIKVNGQSYAQNLEHNDLSAGSPVINSLIPYLVLLYFAGVLFMSLRLLFSLVYLQRFKKKGLIEPDYKIIKVFSGLLNKYNIKRRVKLAESFIAKTPMVLGYFKPLVIVPVGFFSHLPFNQVEAILAHELAHIKRNDFLINIIQAVVELLFFYHPVIYIISKHIREERENCCDDMALYHCEDSTQYVKALARMEGIMPVNPYPAVAFVKEKQNLLNRMKRILNPKTMKTKLSDRIIAGIIILAGFSILLITGAAALNNLSGEYGEKTEPDNSLQLNTPDDHSVNDTIVDFDNNRIITYRKNNKGEKERVEMVFEEGRLAELKLDGELVPSEDYKNYRELIIKTREEVARASREVAQAEKDLEKIDEEEIERKIEEALREAKSIDREELKREMEEARAEIEEIDHEKIRQEVEMALMEAQREIDAAQMESINMDSIRREVQEAMESVDWEEIQRSVQEAMNETGLHHEEIQRAI